MGRIKAHYKREKYRGIVFVILVAVSIVLIALIASLVTSEPFKNIERLFGTSDKPASGQVAPEHTNEKKRGATDKIIVEPRKSAVEKSLGIERNYKKVLMRARKFGLNKYLATYKEFELLVNRIERNKELGVAFINAKKKGVDFWIADIFSIQGGFMLININATDEEILNFLLTGEKPKKMTAQNA